MPDKLENRRIPYFGDFVLFDEIGRGGMGVVYNAQQTKLDRPVALKVLHSSLVAGEVGVQRLRVEAEATARLDHPNIVPVFEFGEHEGHPFLAMQLVEGQSLAERMAGGKVGEVESEKDLREGVSSHAPTFSPAHFPRKESEPPHVGCYTPRESAALLAKIARAVHHAHERGVLHRDLKPGNILLDESGEPHLIDFGLAKCLGLDAGITQTGAFLGTPAYTSPEQAAGQNKSITTASDIYSLGAILYALLTGQPPLVGESVAETIELLKTGSPRRLRSIRSSLSADLEIICHKCLEKEPARRYVSALALAEDIERFLDGRPISARPVGAVERLWMWTRRNPVHAALGITASLLVLAFIVGMLQDAKARTTLLQVRAAAAEAQSQDFRRNLLLEQIQVTRLTPRHEGWSKRAWSNANEAAQIQTTVKSGNLRNQAAALLAGLDAHIVEPFPSFGVSSVLFDQEGTRLLAGGFVDGAKIWDARTGQFQTFTQTNSGPLAFADGSPVELRYDPSRRALLLAAVAGSNALREWRIPAQVDALELGTNPPTLTVLTPDGISSAATLAVADGRHALLAFRSNTISLVAVLGAPVGRLAISRDGSWVAAAHAPNRISVWSVNGGDAVAEFQTDRNDVLCLAFKRTCRVPELLNPRMNGTWVLAAGDSGGNVTLWDLHAQTVRRQYPGGHHGVDVVAFNPDGTLLASGGRGPVKLWDLATGRLLLDLQVWGAGECLTGLDFVPDGKSLAMGAKGADGKPHKNRVTLCALEFGRGIQTLRGLSSQISKMCFSADGTQLAALSHNWEVGIWDLSTGYLRRVFEVAAGATADNAALAFDPSGERLAFAASKAAKLWHVESGVELGGPWALPPGLSDAIAYPDENHLLLGRSETTNGKYAPLGNPHGHDPCVYRIRNLFSTDWKHPVTEDFEFDWRISDHTVSRDGRVFVVEGELAEPGDSRPRRRLTKAYDGLTGKELWRFPFNGLIGGGITIAATGHVVALRIDNTMNAELVELTSGSPILRLPWIPSAIGPHAEYYAVQSPDRGFSLFKGTNLSPLVTLGIDGGDSLLTPQYDRAGNQLAWGNLDGTVTVCDLKEVRARLGKLGLAW